MTAADSQTDGAEQRFAEPLRERLHPRDWHGRKLCDAAWSSGAGASHRVIQDLKRRG